MISMLLVATTLSAPAVHSTGVVLTATVAHYEFALPGLTPAHAALPVDVEYQVKLEVKFATVNTETLRDFGIRPGMEVRDFSVAPTFAGFPANVEEDEEFWDAALRYAGEFGSFRTTMNSGFQQTLDGMATVTFKSDPQELRQGGWTNYRLEAETRDYFGALTLDRITRVEWQPEVRETIGTTEVPFGRFHVPLQLTYDYVPDPDPGAVQRLGGLTFTDEYAGKLGRPDIWFPRLGLRYDVRSGDPVNATQYVRDVGRSLGENEVNRLVGASGLELPRVYGMLQSAGARGDDMNRLRFPGDPEGLGDINCGSAFDAPIGTTWVPSQPGYQTMMNFTPLQFRFEPSLSEGGVVLTAEMQTHCLSMSKKEPDAGVAYFPYAPSDTMLPALGRVANASRFRGPWDQARTWIYTDKASMEEINKRLFPPVSVSQYVNGLWDVVRLGGFGERDLKNRTIFTPSLLLCVTSRDEAVSWLVAHLSSNFARDTGGWLSRAPAEMTNLATGDDTDKKHLRCLVPALLSQREKETRIGALEFLMKLRSPDVLKDGVGSLRVSLFSEDPKEVELALDVSARFQETRPLAAIRVLAEKGATDAIRRKAAALLG